MVYTIPYVLYSPKMYDLSYYILQYSFGAIVWLQYDWSCVGEHLKGMGKNTSAKPNISASPFS